MSKYVMPKDYKYAIRQVSALLVANNFVTSTVMMGYMDKEQHKAVIENFEDCGLFENDYFDHDYSIMRSVQEIADHLLQLSIHIQRLGEDSEDQREGITEEETTLTV